MPRRRLRGIKKVQKGNVILTMSQARFDNLQKQIGSKHLKGDVIGIAKKPSKAMQDIMVSGVDLLGRCCYTPSCW